MPAMSNAEYRGFVTAETRMPKWVAAHRDGRPHVVPVWFVLEGDGLLTTGVGIDDDRPPYAFVLIEGCASVSTDPMPCCAPALSTPPAMSGAEEYGWLNAGEGMLVVRITAEKWCRRTTSSVNSNGPRS
jgi:hypothetical protein